MSRALSGGAPPRSVPMRTLRPRARTTSRALAVGVLVAYNTWVLGPLVWPGDGAPAYLSELAADDQPWQWIFRAGDLLTGLMLLAVAARGRSRWRTWLGGWARAVAVALGVCGAGSVADAVGNMPCSPTLDAACQDTAGLSGVVHVIASTAVGAGFLAVVALLTLALRQRGASRAQLWAGAAATCTLALATLATLALIVLAPGQQVWPQAAQVLGSSLLAAFLALKLDGGNEGGGGEDGEGRAAH